MVSEGSIAGRSAVRTITGELVEFIARETGLDKKIILMVLKAEEDFLMLQISKSLGSDQP
ncbi:hypothetical protein [Pyrococcus sp. ST04]|uniref:hypothetical protein n=1 Tax=Pyrococcus sp. ST04 TaxID=1183377 RepID=UPI0002605E5D|nr:hypothetical protein [Pyrococcus sp. ST04]AFK22576.1 hypothetical protein Py04_0994 [Pyrococcus sp. ST04]